MSHSHSADHGRCPFPRAEVEKLRAEDISAGTAIVLEMLGIFLIGIVLYLVVCYYVA